MHLSANGSARKVQGILDWFIHARLKTNSELHLRARFLVGLSLGIGLLLTLVSATQDYFLREGNVLIYLQYLAIFVLLFGPLLLRYTGSLFLLVFSVALIEAGVLITYTQLSGGISSPGIFWYPVIPVMSMLYLKPRWGILISAILISHVLFMAFRNSELSTNALLDIPPNSMLLGTTVPPVIILIVTLVYIWMEKNARVARDKMETRYQQILKSPMQGVIVFRGDHIVFSNDATATLFGCASKEALLLLSVSRLIGQAPPNAERLSRMRIDTARLNLTPLHLDVMFTPIEWEGEPATQAFLRDVTKEYQYQVELELQNRNLEWRVAERTEDLNTKLLQMDTAGRIAKLGYWEWHIQESSISFSKGLTRSLGLQDNIESVPVDVFLNIVHEDDRQRIIETAEHTLSGGVIFDLEFRIMFPQLGERWLAALGEPFGWTPDVQPSMVVGSVQDITEKRRVQTRKLEEQKRESLGAIAAGLAHDFNNILTPIHLYSDMIISSPDAEKTREYAETISDASKRAAALVNQILSFARESPVEKKKVDIRALIIETTELLKVALSFDVTIVLQLDEAVPHTWTDPNHLHAILMNLCINARDAMPDGGILTIELSEAREDNQNFARIKVSDTGTGMELETQRRMFEPYFSTKPTSRGTGLGLAVTDGVARSLGARIEVDSVPGKGTEISILIPIEQKPEQVTMRSTSSASGSQKLHLVVVDDDKMVLEVIKVGLAGLGHDVTAFCSPVEAAKHLATHANSVDLLIVDRNMPELDGVSLAREALSYNSVLPILMVSGLLDGSTAEDLGVSATLDKPFSITTLAQQITELTIPQANGEVPLS